MHLASQEKKNVTTTASPIKDGGLELGVTIDKKRVIKYTETVLEGHENESIEEPPVEVPAPVVAAAPVKPLKPVKPAGAGAMVQKPAGEKPPAPVQKPAGEKPPAPVQKPAGEKPPAPVQKPAGEKPPAPVQEPAADPHELLQAKIMKVREAYMGCRTKLQSMTQGTPQYKEIYDNAVSLKAEYENLSKIYESGGPVPEGILKELRPADPIEELKSLMTRYNELKGKLTTLDSSSPDYASTKQAALDTYNEYNEKRAKAKEQGLVS